MAIGGRIRVEVFARDGFTCVYCGTRSAETPLHVDHVEPRSKGGANALENYVTACERCNLGKGARPLFQDMLIVTGLRGNELFRLTPRQVAIEPWQRTIVTLMNVLFSRFGTTGMFVDTASGDAFDEDCRGVTGLAAGYVRAALQRNTVRPRSWCTVQLLLNTVAQTFGGAKSMDEIHEELTDFIFDERAGARGDLLS